MPRKYMGGHPLDLNPPEFYMDDPPEDSEFEEPTEDDLLWEQEQRQEDRDWADECRSEDYNANR